MPRTKKTLHKKQKIAPNTKLRRNKSIDVEKCYCHKFNTPSNDGGCNIIPTNPEVNLDTKKSSGIAATIKECLQDAEQTNALLTDIRARLESFLIMPEMPPEPQFAKAAGDESIQLNNKAIDLMASIKQNNNTLLKLINHLDTIL